MELARACVRACAKIIIPYRAVFIIQHCEYNIYRSVFVTSLRYLYIPRHVYIYRAVFIYTASCLYIPRGFIISPRYIYSPRGVCYISRGICKYARTFLNASGKLILTQMAPHRKQVTLSTTCTVYTLCYVALPW